MAASTLEAQRLLDEAKARRDRARQRGEKPQKVPQAVAAAGPGDKKDCPVAESPVPSSPGTASSQATTVPAPDEEARSKALASYEQSKLQHMQTPQDKIRRAPATPHMRLARASSQPIFADPLADKANEADPPTDKARQADSLANKKPAQKNQEQQPKKTQKNKTKSQKSKKSVKKTSMKKNKAKGKGKKSNKRAEKKAEQISGGKHLPLPATAAQAAQKPAAPEQPAAPMQPVKQEPSQEPALKQPKLEHATPVSPAPSTVQALLNRAGTEDLAKHNAALPPCAATGTTQATSPSIAAPNASGAPAAPNAPGAPAAPNAPAAPAAPNAPGALAGHVSPSAPPGKTSDGAPPPPPPPEPSTLDQRVGRKPRDKTLHARRMRFYRSLDGKNTPDEIRELAENARTGGKKTEKMTVLFEEWANCNEDWSRSTFMIRMKEKTTDRQKGGRRWMTRADITEKYAKGGRSMEEAAQVADDIIANPVMRAHNVRPHPDAPLRADMTLYLVWDESFETTEVDTVIEQLFTCKDSTSKPKGSKPKSRGSKNKKRKSASSSESSDKRSSSSSNANSSDESSSSPDAKRKRKGKKGKESKAKTRKTQKKGKEKKRKDKSASESADDDESSKSEDESEIARKKAEEKAKKDAKDAEKQKQRDLKKAEADAKKEVKKAEMEKKKEETKAQNKKRGGVKKAIASLDNAIGDTVRRTTLAANLSSHLREAIEKDLKSHCAKLKQTRSQLQDALDNDKLEAMEHLEADAKTVVDEYQKSRKAVQ